MGHKVYRAHLIAVQINGGCAKDSSVLDGGGDVLLKVVGEGHLVVRMAVAADRCGSVKLHFLIGAALLQGGGDQRGLGVHQLPVRKACKGPVQDLGGLPVNVVKVGAQHHQPVGVAVLLSKGHIAPARQGGKPGLHAPDVIPVVGVLRVEHQVGGGDGALVLVQIGGRQGITQGVCHLHIGLVLGAGLGDQGQLVGRGDVAVIIQAVHTGKAGAGAAQLFGTLVHPGHKGGQVAVRNITGDRAGRVVGAGHQQAVQQVDAAHRFTDAQVDGAAVGVLDVLELLGQAGGDGDLRVHVLAAFQKQQGCHHLGQAGNVALLVRVLFQNGLVDVRVEQIDRLALVHSLDGHFVCGQTGQDKGQGQRCGQQQGRRPAEESRVLHKRILQRKLPASLNQKLKHYIKEYHK